MAEKQLGTPWGSLVTQTTRLIVFDLVRAEKALTIIGDDYTVSDRADLEQLKDLLTGYELKHLLQQERAHLEQPVGTQDSPDLHLGWLYQNIEKRRQYLRDPSLIGTLGESASQARVRLLRDSRSGLFLRNLLVLGRAAAQVDIDQGAAVEIDLRFVETMMSTTLADMRHSTILAKRAL